MTDSEKIELLEAKVRVLELEIEALKSKALPVVPWVPYTVTDWPWTITF